MKIIGDATFMLYVYDRGSLSKFEEVDKEVDIFYE